MDDILCQTWVDIGKSIENSREGNDAIQNANGDLSSKASSGNQPLNTEKFRLWEGAISS